MLTLYFFAPVAFHYLGDFSFCSIYLGSLIFGSSLTLLFHKDDYSYRAIGASGAVTGILYSMILLQPDMNCSCFLFRFPFRLMLCIGYLLYSIYGMRAKNDNIGHTAHFGVQSAVMWAMIFKEPELITDNNADGRIVSNTDHYSFCYGKTIREAIMAQHLKGQDQNTTI